jgi:hypothetical protein
MSLRNDLTSQLTVQVLFAKTRQESRDHKMHGYIRL